MTLTVKLMFFKSARDLKVVGSGTATPSDSAPELCGRNRPSHPVALQIVFFRHFGFIRHFGRTRFFGNAGQRWLWLGGGDVFQVFHSKTIIPMNFRSVRGIKNKRGPLLKTKTDPATKKHANAKSNQTLQQGLENLTVALHTICFRTGRTKPMNIVGFNHWK